MKRPCIEDGCPALTTTTRCPAHERARDKARGTRQQRGYDQAHVDLRAAYQARMDGGARFTCWRCGGPVNPSAWHLGHKPDRSLPAEPQCLCNLQTASISHMR